MLKSSLLKKLDKQNKIAPPKKNEANSRKSKRITHDVNEDIPQLIPISEPQEYDEEICGLGTQFRVEPSNVQQAVEGLIKFTSENPKLKNKLFDDEEFPIYMQINSIKTPRLQSQIVRIPLKHSILTPDSEICLIVPDVKGIPNKEHEKHLDHYEKLLRQRGVNNIKKIMTFHEFRTEYDTFEMKRKLVELYDVFLVDGCISGKTVNKCGKIFYNKRKVPTAIKLRASKLKEHIEQTLHKSALYIHSKGDSFVVQIGHSKMKICELVENAFYVFKGLNKDFPGGFANLRSLNLFAHKGLVIPIYTTLKNQNKVVLKKKEEKYVMDTESGELTTRLNAEVIVKPTGEVQMYKTNNGANYKWRKSGQFRRKKQKFNKNVDNKRQTIKTAPKKL